MAWTRYTASISYTATKDFPAKSIYLFVADGSASTINGETASTTKISSNLISDYVGGYLYVLNDELKSGDVLVCNDGQTNLFKAIITVV